ncbi:MAG: aspartate kinase, partial [Endomicrobium sp.]|nr:aspartate kinase [Endomicrobium sp.]
MILIVMKFGASSVADADKMKLVASIIIAKKNAGNKVMAVVSAPGDTTDELLEMADKITSNPPAREMDVFLATEEMISISLLDMAIDALGEKVVSLTRPQSGILVDINYTSARVKIVNPKKINSLLSKNNIVIVA